MSEEFKAIRHKDEILFIFDEEADVEIELFDKIEEALKLDIIPVHHATTEKTETTEIRLRDNESL